MSSQKSNTKRFNITLPKEIKQEVKSNDLVTFNVMLAQNVSTPCKAFIIDGEGSVNINYDDRNYSQVYFRRGLKFVVSDDVKEENLDLLFKTVDLLPDIFLFGNVTVFATANSRDYGDSTYIHGSCISLINMNSDSFVSTGRESKTFYIRERDLVFWLAFNLMHFINLDHAGSDNFYTDEPVLSKSTVRIAMKWRNDLNLEFESSWESSWDLAHALSFWALDEVGFSSTQSSTKIMDYVSIAEESVKFMESLK